MDQIWNYFAQTEEVPLIGALLVFVYFVHLVAQNATLKERAQMLEVRLKVATLRTEEWREFAGGWEDEAEKLQKRLEDYLVKPPSISEKVINCYDPPFKGAQESNQ